jgi:cytochrome c oxidase subunit 1
MTTIGITRPFSEPAKRNYLNCATGFWSWAATLDHKRIGILYLVSVLTSFFVAGVFALLVRTELIHPGLQFLTQDQFNQMFTLHGAIMVFLVIIPSVPASLGNFVLPIMLGAKDVAFPRLNLFSYYLWVTGAILAVSSIFLGGVDTGWTFYVPYSIRDDGAMRGAAIFAVAVFVLGFSSIFTGMNFITTIHRLRPPGMTWFRMPLFLWSIYATGILQVMATPVIGVTVALLVVERLFGIGIFNPALGGDPVLFQHFFWFYSHPAVYIMILPAMGVVSELIAVHSHKHIFGYKFIAFSSVAIAAFSFLVWGHHMFTSSQSPLMNVIFSAITFSVAIPSAVKVFNWLATMYKGSISLNTAMLYGLAFIFLFTIGGLTGLHLGTLATDIHLHDTYFVVAHFHYVMLGSAIIGMFGGLHHWWPKMTGRMFSETWGRIGWFLVFWGFNQTFFTQFVLGSLGMPRRYADYANPPGTPEGVGWLPETTALFWKLHLVSTIGSYIMGLGFAVTAVYLLHSLFRGRPAPANPWGGRSLEWQCDSPPPVENFATTPHVGDCYDFSVLEWDEQEQGYHWRRDLKHEPGEG